MGSLPVRIATDPWAVDRLAQTLMVYRLGTEDFKVTASSDIDRLRLRSERGLRGDRFEITVSLVPHRIRPGKLEGTIFLKTNDTEFSQLAVPVTASIRAR
jgi:hypothetical protein